MKQKVKALTETEAKLVAGRDASIVKVTVVNVQALTEVVVAAHHLGAVVACSLGNGVRELAVGVSGSVQNIHEGIATLLRGETSPDNSLDGGESENLLEDDGTNTVDNDDDVGVGACYSSDKIVSVVPGIQVDAITSVVLDSQVALARVGSNEYQGNILSTSSGSASTRLVCATECDGCTIAGGTSADGIIRRDEIGVVDGTRTPAHAESTVVAAVIRALVA